ncbi:MAG: 4Fe-4S binding protein [Treponema sp.]|nr:4Fe-4S binding protein [Treponema sp.]
MERAPMENVPLEKAPLERAVKEYILQEKGNYVLKEIALRPDLAGMKIFDDPVFGYAAADDSIFLDYKKPGVIGAHFMAPSEWLPNAKSVISVFLPFTNQVREANRKTMDWPADEWLHARIEGHAFQKKVVQFIIALLTKDGKEAIAPMLDSRFSQKSPVTENKREQDFYTSNWSERHAAYACGLGTFGLSKGLITAKGVAGRYISVITSALYKESGRPYTGIYDYCIKCGACAKNCPAKAITIENGKNHFLCSEFLNTTREKYDPRYGCGKCQVKVPCEFRAPGGGKVFN